MRRSLLAVMLTVAFVLARVVPAAAQDAARARLQGTFVNEAQPAEPIRTAIDAAVAKMNFVTRPIARRAKEGQRGPPASRDRTNRARRSA